MLQFLKKHETRKLVSRLMREFIAPYTPKLMLALVFMILVALATAALAYMIKPIIDNGFAHPKLDILLWACAAVFLTFVVKGGASYGESVVMTFVGQRIISDIQNCLFKHIMRLDLAYFHNTPSGELLSRFTNDVNMMRNAMENTLLNLGKDLILLVCLIALMFHRDPWLATIAFIVFPIAVFPIIKIGKRMRKVTFHTQDQHAVLTNQLSQTFQGIRVVKAYCMEKAESNLIEQQINTIFHLIYKATRIRSASHPIMEILAGLAIACVMAYGGWEVMEKIRTPGDFASFITALLLVYDPLKRLSNLNARLQEGIAAAYRVTQILDMPPKIQNSDNPRTLTRVAGHIEFRDVTFNYQKQKLHTLDQLSFEAKPGQTIALVGASGAGKSTIINLIPRFYDITHGDILVDGVNIKELDIADLRKHIALVSQEIALFDRSIFDNIAYSEKAISMDEVVAAAKSAAAHEFIERLPNGYDTYVGENGVKLSGGQRQRIAIARAMLKDAPILLLDEATSALDTDSERQIQDALSRLMKGRTTILVAHRLSTVIDADWIYVLDHGKLVESGGHHDLLKQDGVYARLWKKQSTSKI
ncbi:MAG: lipid A export permease/ATP-binding protein MsbA [Alphaproteobacteria bacterium]|nr:lipid A export permease/ATP-binding protein MsbA [Alphaproteobacteria bacterium]